MEDFIDYASGIEAITNRGLLYRFVYIKGTRNRHLKVSQNSCQVGHVLKASCLKMTYFNDDKHT